MFFLLVFQCNWTFQRSKFHHGTQEPNKDLYSTSAFIVPDVVANSRVTGNEVRTRTRQMQLRDFFMQSGVSPTVVAEKKLTLLKDFSRN